MPPRMSFSCRLTKRRAREGCGRLRAWGAIRTWRNARGRGGKGVAGPCNAERGGFRAYSCSSCWHVAETADALLAVAAGCDAPACRALPITCSLRSDAVLSPRGSA
jgi:hypothetical protein